MSTLTLTPSALQPHLARIERARNSRVLVVAATDLDAGLLPALYEQCAQIGHTPRLDVVLHSRGGDVQAARRIGLLLRAQCDHLAFLVPYHCASAATLLTLCADEIVAGSMAMFTPIDAHLNGADGGACSVLDIARFGDMAADWFGVGRADTCAQAQAQAQAHVHVQALAQAKANAKANAQANAQALALLSRHIAPAALVAFYRAEQLMTQVADELLAFQLPAHDAGARRRIVDRLTSGYHSHSYAISGDDLKSLGLRVCSDAALMTHAWAISRLLQTIIGPRCRDDIAMPWHDALVATRAQLAVRQRQPDGRNTPWAVDSAA